MISRVNGAGAALLAAALTGCLQGGQISSGGSAGSIAGTSGTTTAQVASSSGTTGASSSGVTSSSNTSAGSGTSGSSSTGSGSSTGAPLAPVIDGGWVFCSDGDAGWLCSPGTYLCDLTDKPGNCFQCLSDSDCANRDQPTYDSRRPRCDLSSGVPGYEHFCQQCTSDADCAVNPTAPYCDLNPALAGGLTPTIDTLGFESCGRTETDCRKDGGLPCGINMRCDPASGACQQRSLACATAADCAGLFANTNQPLSWCFDGTCTLCAGGVCPGSCGTDADCGNPDGSVAGLLCNESVCQCQDSSQCGGETPVCLPPGDFLSYCGCSDDQDCGDAGLHCFSSGSAYSFCGISCGAPEAPACPTDRPICDLDSGLCGYCFADEDCISAHAPAGKACIQFGVCGCTTAADCPGGQACLPGLYDATCGVALPDCDPSTCPGTFCDWDAGVCIASRDGLHRSCITDYDCTGGRCVAGSCVQCVDDNDCVVEGELLPQEDPGTYCGGNVCRPACRNDIDCVGNPGGPSCLVFGDAGFGKCQDEYCHSNADCAANFYGHFCDLDGGWGIANESGACGCLQDSDCNPGDACQNNANPPFCVSARCQTDADCAPGERCYPTGVCRAQCDDGGACGTVTPVCDTTNAAGQNGQTVEGADPSVVWCYQCLSSADCPDGLACYPTYGHVCGACSDSTQCASGACFNAGTVNGICLAVCDGGGCGAGSVCDTGNVTGNGANLCYQCLGPFDCPNGGGCNGQTHLCGTCSGPTADGGSSDCPPGDVCSNYWATWSWPMRGPPPGVCLQQCEDHSCPADRPMCEIFPSLSQDLPFCFGCLTDADCADAGPGAWCDTSLSLTFTCQAPWGGP